jgi:hypothetical protein
MLVAGPTSLSGVFDALNELCRDLARRTRRLWPEGAR